MQNIQIFHCFQTTTRFKHPFPSVLWLFKDMQSTNYEGHEDRSTFWKRSMPSCKINITSFHRVPSVWIDKDKECLRHMILIGKVKPYFLHIMILLQNVELFTRNYASFVLSKISHFSALTVIPETIEKCLHQSVRTKFMYFLPFENVCLDKLQTI